MKKIMDILKAKYAAGEKPRGFFFIAIIPLVAVIVAASLLLGHDNTEVKGEETGPVILQETNGEEEKDSVTLQEAQESITSGVVVAKHIVEIRGQGRPGGHGRPGKNDNSDSTEPTENGVDLRPGSYRDNKEYRIYIKAECGVDGELKEFEKYFIVSGHVYRQYKIGDFFNSLDHIPENQNRYDSTQNSN